MTPKARLIPLSDPFISYLRADGIVLPPEPNDHATWSDDDSGIFSSTEDPDAEEEEDEDPSTEWREVHEAISNTIEELGGRVIPKLNWSAPKDATWISATNTMECRTPNDIYLLLKSSDFITHDLEHAFDDCEDDEPTTPSKSQAETPDKDKNRIDKIPYHLILRKSLTLNPSVEFRCFVRDRTLIAICQRDLNHFDFLFKMQDKLRSTIQEFFDAKIRDTFPDENFTFDVYIPPPHERVWLIDFNPWAVRTDPLLFSWLELLTLPVDGATGARSGVSEIRESGDGEEDEGNGEGKEEEDEKESTPVFVPEFRLVRRDDPEAYSFTTTQYSAHKLPKDVVDTSRNGEGGLREFATKWKDVLEKRQAEDAEDSEEE